MNAQLDESCCELICDVFWDKSCRIMKFSQNLEKWRFCNLQEPVNLIWNLYKLDRFHFVSNSFCDFPFLAWLTILWLKQHNKKNFKLQAKVSFRFPRIHWWFVEMKKSIWGNAQRNLLADNKKSWCINY